MRGPEFLKKKYNLHNTPEVKSAVTRTEKKTGKKVPQNPDAQIQNYLDRFTEILERKDPKERERGLSALKEILHEKMVTKPEDVPESHFELQRRIAAEQGHGDIKISPEQRARLVEVVRTDQANSLDVWVDYLASDNAPYEDWFKYYLLRNVGNLSEYDAVEKRFGKRTKDTVKLFPDLNSEAVAYMYDATLANGDKKSPEEPPISAIDAKLKDAYKAGDFAKMYEISIEKTTAKSAELFPNIEGKWVKYDRGSDHMPLVLSLRTRGTGWCTAGVATAKTQLSNGDFHVYYSLNEKGEATIPRVAIRMQGNSIGEVRGVAPNQNLDEYITPVVKEKLKEFPDGTLYGKRVADMAELTKIVKKDGAGQELTKEELSFLYERDSEIAGFGQNIDPRIWTLKKKRDFEADMMDMCGANKDQTAFKQEELREGITLLTGFLLIDEKTILPKSLQHAMGGADISYDAKNLPESLAEKLTEIGRTDTVARALSHFEQLSDKIARALCEKGHLSEVSGHLDSFLSFDVDTALKISDVYLSNVTKQLVPKVDPKDHQKIADYMMKKGREWELCENLSLFENIDTQKIANALIEKKNGNLLVKFLNQFHDLDLATAKKLIGPRSAGDVGENLDAFASLDAETAFLLILDHQGSSVIDSLEKFEPIDHMEIARNMIANGQGSALIDRLYKLKDTDTTEIGRLLLANEHPSILAKNIELFPDIDHNKLVVKLLQRDSRSLATHIKKFKDLSFSTAHTLYGLNSYSLITNNIHSFRKEDQPDIALLLLNDRSGDQFRRDIDTFDLLDTRVAEKLQEGYFGADQVVEHPEKFGELSRKVDRKLLRQKDITLQTYLSRIGKRALKSLGFKTSLVLTRDQLKTRPPYTPKKDSLRI